MKKKKREVAKGQEKAKEKEKKKKYKAEGLSKKKRKKSTKCLWMPKAFELKEKLREAQSAWKKKDVACLVELYSLYCMHMWW